MPIEKKRVDHLFAKLKQLIQQVAEDPSADRVHILRTNTRRSEVLLVAVTGAPMRGDAAMLRPAGYSAYLRKQCDSSQLYNTITEILRAADQREPSDAPLVTRHSLAERKKAQRRKATVLLAEDNLMNQRLTVRLLDKVGFQADVVTNGREAVEAVRNNHYDLVLMDCQMPEMDGFDATGEIRRMEGELRHTLICALTANAMVGDRERCLEAGMDDYISKPIGLEELQRALHRLLYQKPQSADEGSSDSYPWDQLRRA